MRKYLIIVLQFAFAAAPAQTSGLGPFNVYNVYSSSQLKNADKFIDSLRPLLELTKEDTAKINVLFLIADTYRRQIKRDSSFWYNQKALNLSQKLNYVKGAFDARYRLATVFRATGNYPQALQLTLTNLPIAEQYKDTLRLYFTLMDLCGINNDMNDFVRQLAYTRSLQQLTLSGYFKRHSDGRNMQQLRLPYLINMALAFDGLDQKDSALYYLQHYYTIALSLKDTAALTVATGNLSDILLKLGRSKEAHSYYYMAIKYATTSDRPYWIANSYLGWQKYVNKKINLIQPFIMPSSP